MPDKKPQSPASKKKPSKSLKQKRVEKRDKQRNDRGSAH